MIEKSQKRNHQNIFYNEFWTTEEIKSWLKKERVEIKELVLKHPFQSSPKNVKSALLDSLCEILLKEDIKTYDKDIDLPINDRGYAFFMGLLGDDFCNLLELKSRGKTREVLKFEENGSNSAQKIINMLKKAPQFLIDNLDLILLPIEEKIKSYVKKKDPLEIALRNNLFSIFRLFSENIEVLTNEQKEIQMAAAFSFLSKNSGIKFLEESEKTTWVKNVLFNTDFEIFEKHFYKVKKSIETYPVITEIETIYLNRKLDFKLSNKKDKLITIKI